MRLFICLSWLTVFAVVVGCAPSSRFIDSIYLGQDIKELSEEIGPITDNFFEVLEDGALHQFIQAKHSKSGKSFGLYFENGKLAGVIIEQDVTRFHYRRSSQLDDPHWLAGGFTSHREWLLERSLLDSGFSSLSKKQSSPKSSAGNIGDEIAHIIFGLGFLPYAPFVWAAQKEDANIQEDENFIQALNSLHIGSSEETLIHLMELGKLGRRTHIDHSGIYTFLLPSYSTLTRLRLTSYSFGVKDGKIVWIESCSMLVCSY